MVFFYQKSCNKHVTLIPFDLQDNNNIDSKLFILSFIQFQRDQKII